MKTRYPCVLLIEGSRRWNDGWEDVWMDERMNGWMNEWMNVYLKSVDKHWTARLTLANDSNGFQ